MKKMIIFEYMKKKLTFLVMMSVKAWWGGGMGMGFWDGSPKIVRIKVCVSASE